MKFTNSPFLYLSISLTLVCLALGFLPQIVSDAVSLEVAKNEVVVAPAPALPIIPPAAPAAQEDTEGQHRGPVYKVVDQMPMFPGCEDKGKYALRERCANKKLLTYVYENIRYPEKAREKGVEGMAVVSFIVEKDGRISTAKIVRDPGAGLGKEALRTVKLMQVDDIYWYPGRQDGKPVRVQFHLPVKFKLE